MFTGIIESLGRILHILPEKGGVRLHIHWPTRDLNEPFVLGESIAINGCCLTVVSSDGPEFEVQVGPETLDRTNLRLFVINDAVNLERALKIGNRLGGHFVQGHVDTTAIVIERRTEGEWEFVRFRPNEERWLELMVEKGSIAVDGISLTIVDVDAESFTVMLIPHTLSVTTLGLRQVGSRVNLETDILAKHVQKLLNLGKQA